MLGAGPAPGISRQGSVVPRALPEPYLHVFLCGCLYQHLAAIWDSHTQGCLGVPQGFWEVAALKLVLAHACRGPEGSLSLPLALSSPTDRSWYFVTAFLWCNSHTTSFTRVNQSSDLYSKLCIHHNFRTFSLLLKETPHPLTITSYPPPHSSRQPLKYFMSLYFSLVNILYKWNHTIFILLYLASLA